MDRLKLWIESYLFYPNRFQNFISYLLTPLSLLYSLVIFLKRLFSKERDFKIKIISVGNLTIGGSGKTPFTIAISKYINSPCIILRGYGRKSKGLRVVSKFGKLIESVENSGDEAMLLAKSIPNSTVIVSENRDRAILVAKELGHKVVILDDGFSKYHIKKFNILLKPNLNLRKMTIPSGPYRETPKNYKFADFVAVEGVDYIKKVEFENLKPKMLLLSAISNPNRLLSYLPKDTIVTKLFLPDHSYFDEFKIEKLIQKHQVDSILTTEKDFVKLEKFKRINISLMKLKLTLSKELEERILNYLKEEKDE